MLYYSSPQEESAGLLSFSIVKPPSFNVELILSTLSGFVSDSLLSHQGSTFANLDSLTNHDFVI